MVQISIDSKDPIEIEKKGKEIHINNKLVDYRIEKNRAGTLQIFKGNKIFEVELISKTENELMLSVDGKTYSVTVKDHIDQILSELGMSAVSTSKISEIKAPMPGTILSVSTAIGEKVEKGTPLLVLEAMKMENVIKSPGDGVVNKILISQGDNVEKNELLISFE